jgi:hypothetical protein
MSDIDAFRKQQVSGNNPKGIGGWLILPMLGLFLSPILGLWELRNVPSNLDLARQLGGQGALLLYFEMVSNALLLVAAPIALLMAFFAQSRRFPSWYITMLLVGAAFVFLDTFAAYNIFLPVWQAGTPFWTPEVTQPLIRSAIGVAIWVPYMLNSVRVKNTFVN